MSAPNLYDYVDQDTFKQLLELDDEDDHSFSYSTVSSFFTQTELALREMESALTRRDLLKVSHLGFSLKGTSGAIGAFRIQKSSEKLQDYGHCIDGSNSITVEEAWELIPPLVSTIKTDYHGTEKALKSFYAEDD
ncbi:hypothetical protein DFQ27_000634 [Actinomortierella ambigua]|uniref:HPt domain-containing protein n=1 Tax=Actinomortierella ambigua TaxID=1343610 RepID=A0A9P6QFG6_9FUNG|nr:hypothetical protein DFQ27_000634 [Actinomortierella ambigua]